MKLKSEYINPEHKKALEELERYLSDIAGKPVEAVEVESEEDIFEVEVWNIFKFLLSKRGEVIGLSICKFGNKLTSVPELILAFKYTLKFLSLSYNRLSNLAHLKDLVNLQELDLAVNEVNNISQLRELKDLRTLWLSKNKIRDLSPLMELVELQWLNVSYNQISDIGPLRNLKEIWFCILQNNQIKYLPYWVADREVFYEINLFGHPLEDNPLETPPWEVVKQGMEAVRRWFEIDKKYGFEKFSYAKILIVGPGEAGKTSLLKKLQNPEFKPEPYLLETTHGINVDFKEYDINKKELKKIYLSLWDFGGQHIQASLHHYFFSSDALYILVSPARKDDYQLSYWFGVINHFGGENPKVLVLFNQKSPNDIIDADNALKRYKDTYKHFDIDHIVLDLKIDPGDDDWEMFQLKLRKKILSLPTIGKLGLKPWMQVMERLAQLPDNYITKQEFEKIFKEFAPDLDKEYTDDLLQYLNAIGYLIAYPKAKENLLRDFVFIKPSWLIEALYMPLKLYKDYARKRSGVIEINLLRQKWQELGYSDEEIDLFVDLIQDKYFKFAFGLTDKDFLFPAFIPKDVPDFDWQSIEKPEQIMILDFGNFLPESLITRFTVHFNSLIAKDKNGKLLVANKAVVLQYPDGSLAYVVASLEENKIIVKVKTIGEDKRSDIRNKFQELYSECSVKKQFKTLIPCYCDQCQANLKVGKIDEVEFFDYDTVLSAFSKGDVKDKCRLSRQEINLVKLVYGFDFPLSQEPQNITLQYNQFGDNNINSKVYKTNIYGNNNTAVVGNEAQNISINIEEIIPSIVQDELPGKYYRELKETLELFRTETAINLEQLGKDFVELIFDVEAQITDDIKQAILSSAQQARDEKSPLIKFGISLSILKVLETFGIIPPGLAEILEGVNLSASSDAKLKLKQLFRYKT